MFIYVIKAKSLVKLCIVFVIGIIALSIATAALSSDAVTAFLPKKDLPIYSVDTPENKVAITFDCAWGADDIPDILQTLKKENIKATFFIVGQWAEKYPQAVKQIAQEGHDVANHSYSHLRMGAIDSSRIKSEIVKCNEVLSQISGNKIELFRAPYGDYNNEVIRTANELKQYTIQWDVDSLDWKPDISQAEITERVIQRARNGSIILFHNDTAHTAKILPLIISSIKKKGLGFSPVSQLILREKYYIDFEGRQKPKE